MAAVDKQMQKLETMDPVDFLRQFTGGQPVAKPLVQLIYELRKKYSFSNGVINSILEYCLLENDYKIVRSHVFELADELDEVGVKNAQEVYDYLSTGNLGSQSEVKDDPIEKEYNCEYVETNIALIARQLHELRQQMNHKFKHINQQLDLIERRLEQLINLLK
jgi:replication initiation and membrane attachment protein DnaB